MKMRSDCVLTTLTQAQRDEIIDSLTAGEPYRQLQQRCALPAPEGFGIKIQLATLSRFFKAERRRRHAEELAQSKFDELSSGDLDTLHENVRVELAHACYDLAHHPDTTHVNILARITHRLDTHRLEERRLALENEFLAEKKRQFNFNAAREAAKHALEIKETLARKDIDLEDKVWKIGDIVFGPPPASANNKQ